MEENQNQNDLKNETINTVKNVTDAVKNINIKEESNNSKRYLKDLVEDPTGKINMISKDSENLCFKTAIFALILWCAVELIDAIFAYNISFSFFMKNILKILLLTISPAISILILSLIISIMNKKNKKSLNTIITTMITTKIPVILANIIGLFGLITSSAYKLTSPISGFLSAISILLVFFGIKNLFDSENNNSAIKDFTIVMGLYYIAKFLLTFLGISI